MYFTLPLNCMSEFLIHKTMIRTQNLGSVSSLKERDIRESILQTSEN